MFVVSEIKTSLPHKDPIRRKGFNLLVTTSGKEALTIVKKYPIDLIITEIPTGKMDGIELAHSIETSKYHIPLVFIADKRKEYFQIIKKSFPNYETLKEPFTSDNIIELIEKIVKPTTRTGNHKILLVDDSEDMRLIFKTLLKKQNYEITEAENGEVGLQEFKKQKFDFVFMDMEMPVMNGYSATQLMRQHEVDSNSPPTPIVAFTASANNEIEKAKSAGCDEVLAKPLQKIPLLKLLEAPRIKKAA